MATVKSGSLEPAQSGANLSYDRVTFTDCCPDEKPAVRVPTPLAPPPPPPPAPCQSGCVEPVYESQIENAILKAHVEPLSTQEAQEITVLGNRGIWTNREEISQWKSEYPLEKYLINEDAEPTIIHKKYQQEVVYEQELAVRYLRPPAPPAPGDIIISHEPNVLTAPAPPLIIRQMAPRPCTPEPLVVREIPPPMPEPIGQKIITIAGKGLPPPPRKVIIERLPPVPAKPQAVINERWLPYESRKRRVIYQAPQPDPVYCKPKNVIVQWDAPNVRVEQVVKYLGIVNANPQEYITRYGETLRYAQQFPDIIRNIKHQEGLVLAADAKVEAVPELVGDVAALKLIDLQREGLAEYSNAIASRSTASIGSANVVTTSVSAILSGAVEGSVN
jgi:hypothetical protein